MDPAGKRWAVVVFSVAWDAAIGSGLARDDSRASSRMFPYARAVRKSSGVWLQQQGLQALVAMVTARDPAGSGVDDRGR